MEYNLIGVDGNAFSVMGYVSNAMKKEGKSKDEIRQYTEQATSGDYQHLLKESIKMIDLLNGKDKVKFKLIVEKTFEFDSGCYPENIRTNEEAINYEKENNLEYLLNSLIDEPDEVKFLVE